MHAIAEMVRRIINRTTIIFDLLLVSSPHSTKSDSPFCAGKNNSWQNANKSNHGDRFANATSIFLIEYLATKEYTIHTAHITAQSHSCRTASEEENNARNRISLTTAGSMFIIERGMTGGGITELITLRSDEIIV